MNANSCPSRILGIDAARGTAMALVCLSHVKEHFFTSAPELYRTLMHVTRIATPTFLLLSGFVIGYVLRNSTRAHVRLTFVDRALFLVLVAHFAIGLSDLQFASVSHWAFSRAVITDAIGVAILIGVCVRFASAAALTIVGIAIAVLSWIIGMTLQVDSPTLREAADLMFHLQSVSNPLIDVALLPYVAVFLIGMAFSKHLDLALRRRDERTLSRALLRTGVGAIALVLVASVLWRFSRDWIAALGLDAYVVDLLRRTLDPRFKWPPSPAYLCLYGGAGLVLAAAFLRGGSVRWMQPVTKTMAVPGRAALMCFVVQDWLLRWFPVLLGFDHVHSITFWMVYLAATFIVLYLLSRWWDSHSGNRWLTVGLVPLARVSRERFGSRLGALHTHLHKGMPRPGK